jgi:hypothetical protein
MTPMTQRADLADRLQAAVAERDAQLARRLTDQLVHRRGVPALQALLQGPLEALQGPSAVAWLAELIQVAPPSEPAPLPQSPAVPQALPVARTPEGPAPLTVIEPQPLLQPPALTMPDAAQVEQEAPERSALALRLVPPPVTEPPATPAPAPPALAALRSWLPDPSDLAEAS